MPVGVHEATSFSSDRIDVKLNHTGLSKQTQAVLRGAAAAVLYPHVADSSFTPRASYTSTEPSPSMTQSVHNPPPPPCTYEARRLQVR